MGLPTNHRLSMLSSNPTALANFLGYSNLFLELLNPTSPTTTTSRWPCLHLRKLKPKDGNHLSFLFPNLKPLSSFSSAKACLPPPVQGQILHYVLKYDPIPSFQNFTHQPALSSVPRMDSTHWHLHMLKHSQLQNSSSWVQWHTSLNSRIWRLRLKDHKFKSSFRNLARPSATQWDPDPKMKIERTGDIAQQ